MHVAAECNGGGASSTKMDVAEQAAEHEAERRRRQMSSVPTILATAFILAKTCVGASTFTTNRSGVG